MKLLRFRIRDEAAVRHTPQDVIEKDYVLSYILAGIANTPALAHSLIFKGGTALKKCIFGDYRFSEDLDFTAVNAPRGEELERELRNALRWAEKALGEHGPFKIEIERYEEREPHPGGQEAFTIRVQFPWQREPLCRVKVEISFDEPVLTAVHTRKMTHGYDEALKAEIDCYSFEEIVAEKLRALLQAHQKLVMRGWTQRRARDYYDLWRILKQYEKDLDIERIVPLLREKCRIRAVDFEDVDSFFTKELVAEAKRAWKTMLATFVPDLPECDLVLKELGDMLNKVIATS
jgi:predicted nucleotidyltransferase component of viral defense system